MHVSYDPSLGLVNRPLVTTELLGNAVVPGVPFENPDGSPYRIDADFYGVGRNTNNPCAGPFEFSGTETNRIKLYSYVTNGTSPSLLAYWNFDTPAVSGRYTDVSGNGRDIAVTVAPTHFMSGPGTGALEMAGGQYLTLADDPATGAPALPLATNSFSISYWAKRGTTAANQIVIGMSDPTFSGSVHTNYISKALHIGFRSPTATMDFYADGIDHGKTPADTTSWHHYVFTYDADRHQQGIVIDGDLLTSVYRTSADDFLGDVNANVSASDIKNDFWIGRALFGASFNGMVDEVRVFDGVLSEVELYDLYTSARLPEVPVGAVITPFTGGDVGDGLSFTGAYIYTVNIGGSAASPPVVQGITFTNDSLTPGVTVVLGGTGNLKGNWGTKPEYGATGDDNGLEAMMQVTALSYGIGPMIELTMGVTAGRRYELQLLVSENGIMNNAWGRYFDIAVEGFTIANEFTPIPADASWTTAPHTGYAVTYQFVAGDSIASVVFTGGSSAGDPNPVVQAFTLKDITSPPAIEVWATAYGLTGDNAQPEVDVEPDGMDNLMEYALGGNPTNDDAFAVAPVAFIAAQNGTSWFYHVHTERTNDPRLVVTLGTATDLVHVLSWNNTNDLVLVGETPAGDGFKIVTNRTETEADGKFILLNTEISYKAASFVMRPPMIHSTT